MRNRECRWKGMLEMAESDSIDQYPVTYRMSRATIATGWIVKFLIGILVLLATALDGSIDSLMFSAIGTTVMAAGTLFDGGKIEVARSGVRSRNILTERRYP